ncbi:copper chaperone CopZ [Geomicrobium sp. JCM 19038]|uniref:copper chaperone CopZ n=1 Tax=Geomicrobium sp. JCM 19038 TaxID=1460635 RepID=UPI00045F426B|nr:copper chaperone CopZ [Geomicrobium sp. JCM 19038]GAK07331.1 copper(I) chaperone CopZ [Geomicrobium sp. JCM 19038]
MKDTFSVQGMSCNHCVQAIETSIGQLDGVTNVDVDLNKHQVGVDYNEKTISKQAIVEEIEDQGYDVI